MILTACQPAAAPTAAPAPTEAKVEPAPTEAPKAEQAAPSALPDLKGREVTVAIENAYPPFNYVDAKSGKPGGWDYETWDEICKRLNCKPVYKEAAWEGMIQAVADKQFDAAADGITNTPDRAKVVDFSIGYIKTEQRLLVRKGETRFKSIEDIVKDKALRLGTQTGTTNYETAIKYLPEDRIKAFEQFPFAVQALIAKDIDAVIIDAYAGVGYVGENKENVELIGPSISSDELGFIFPKGSDIVKPVSDAIQSMKDDGTLEKLNLKFFGPDFVAPEAPPSS
jgi:polar amino acid transport system substrate-binding protein